MAIEESDVYWTPAEWAWIASLFDVVFPGLFYGKPVFAYSGSEFDAETTFGLIERYELTNVFAPPTALRMMAQADASTYDLDSVRVLPSGGESLGASVVEWAEGVFGGAAVHEGYGQTEANMLVGDCTSLADFREGNDRPARPGPRDRGRRSRDRRTPRTRYRRRDRGPLRGRSGLFRGVLKRPRGDRREGPERLAV